MVGWGDNSWGQVDAPPDLTNAVAIAAGGRHSLALRDDGTVAAWGTNDYGQLQIPWNLSNVVAIAAGENHNLALKADGRVVAWGSTDYGQLKIPPGLTNVIAVAAGHGHNLALKADGQVVAWGWNNIRQTNVPAGLSNVVAIAAGGYHSLALKSDGTAVHWGGYWGLGSGASNIVAIGCGSEHSLAVRADGTVVGGAYSGYRMPAGLSNAVAVTGGQKHSVALKGDGTVVAWEYRQYVFTNVAPDLTNVAAIAAGLNHSLALVWDDRPRLILPPRSQRVYWGGSVCLSVRAVGVAPFSYQWRKDGQELPGATNDVLSLANVQHDDGGQYQVMVRNPLGDTLSQPAELRILEVAPIILGQPSSQTNLLHLPVEFSVAAEGPPILYQWQFNGQDLSGQTNAVLKLPSGQLSDSGDYRVVLSNKFGTATSLSAKLAVMPVASWGGAKLGRVSTQANEFVTIARGAVHVLALRPDGTVVAWGDNGQDQCRVPSGLGGVVAIAAGNCHSVALQNDGTVVVWGHYYGTPATTPPDLGRAVAIAAGDNFDIALLADGTVKSWGWGWTGRTNVPSGLTNVVAVAGGDGHSLALKQNGTVVAWGCNDYGQADVPLGLADVVAVAAGGYHSLALKRNGTVVGWGANFYGQATAPAGLSSVVAIAAGRYHSLALRQDGTVIAWGSNKDDYEHLVGQATVPPGLTNVVAISARFHDSQVLIGDGSPVITVQPFNRSVPAGTAVTLCALAVGAPPLAYQWQADGTNLPGAANATLTLPDVQFSDAGQYRLIVSNAHGSAASSAATLDIRQRLQLLEPAKKGNAFSLSVPTFVGRTYVLEYNDSLSTDGWTPLAACAGDGATQRFSDPDATVPQRFYRVRIVEAAQGSPGRP